MTHLSIYQTIRAWAERTPDAPAILAPGRTALTYARLYQQIHDTVVRLNERGIGRNDRVAIVLPNGPEMAVAFLAIAAGAASAPLNPGYRDSEFEFFLSDLNAKALVVPAGTGSPARVAAESRGVRVFELQPLTHEPAGLFAIGGEPRPLPVAGGFAEENDIALLLHTSGTTSRPKLVPLTQRNLCASAANIRQTLRLTPADRCLSVMPLFHIHGLVGAILASLAAGASVVCTPGFDAACFFDWMAAYQPTWYTAVPTMHQAILAEAAAHQQIVSQIRLRLIRSSSSPLAPQVMSELERTFSAPVIESYGMTEASHQMCSNPLPPSVRKAGSVGLPAGPDVAIMDEQGNLLPAGATGEIVIRGVNVTSGYENNPAANKAAFASGWFQTGDRGHADGDGYVHVTGRIKELINRGGEKISPREVDEVLLDHPAIAQAVTFAVPHPRLGEDVAAAAVLRKDASVTEQEVREFARSRLADYKVPAQVVFVPEIPKGPTGKLQRIGLYEKLAPLLQAQYVPPGNPVEQVLAGIWSQVLGIDRPGTRDNFFASGGDSLLAVRLVLEIEKGFGRSLPLSALLAAPTIEQLAVLIGNENAPAAGASGSLLVLQGKGTRPPLFCVDGLAGHTFNFRDLALHLGTEQPVYGLQYPGLDGQRAPMCRVEDLAAEFIHQIRIIQPSGPYYLCGLCFGGLVVFEMAQQLTAQNERVGMLLMLDTFAPDADPRQQGDAKIARDEPYDGSSLAEWIDCVRVAGIKANHDYQPRPYAGRVILFRPKKRGKHWKDRLEDPFHGWDRYAIDGVETHAISGRHTTMLKEPKVRRLAQMVRARLLELQSGRSPIPENAHAR